MKLVSAQVEKFRSINDSGEVAIQEDVTALVGKNESGKTAFLEALQRLNPVDPCTFTRLDYPRRLLSDAKKAGTIDETQAISTKFEVEPEDTDSLTSRFGSGTVRAKVVTASRGYGGDVRIGQDEATDQSAAVAHIVEGVAIPDELLSRFGELGAVGPLEALLTELEQPPADGQPVDPAVASAVAGIRARLASVIGTSTDFEAAVREALLARMPRFFYFGDYDFLEGRTDLERVFGDEAALKPGERVALSLMRLAGTDSSSLTEDEYDYRKAELEAVSNKLTAEMANYWSQSTDLDVVIDVDKVTVTRPDGQHAVARNLKVGVRDRRHGFTGNFDERSSGFRWFFSFLARFSEFEAAGERVVILLDEPGLTLHGKAQADFLRFIDERLAPSHQVIYTTHSPFMVQPGRLERVRLVEDRGVDEGSKVSSEVMATDPDTLFPLQAALGYDIAQNLFIAPHNLLVEGTSDYTYLYRLSERLKERGREGLDERWSVLPVGSVTKVSTFLALLGQHLDVTVLVDAGESSQPLADLVRKGQLPGHRLLTPGQVTGAVAADVEDLFELADYLAIYNAAMQADPPLAESELNGTDRVVKRIERARGEFNHGIPADYLLRQGATAMDTLGEVTLSQFEALFNKINATLPSE
jgi:predicted ATPase